MKDIAEHCGSDALEIGGLLMIFRSSKEEGKEERVEVRYIY